MADCPPLAEISTEVLAALHANALVAHNAHVDVDVLRRELPGWRVPEVFDTLRLARRLVPGLSSYKLGVLVERFKLAEGLPSESMLRKFPEHGKDELKPHRATYDALVTARLFVHFATEAGSLEELRGQPPKSDDNGDDHKADEDAQTLF